MRFHLVTTLPESLTSYLSSGVLGRAAKQGVITVQVHDLRQYGFGKYKQVDDRPYGGGVGMVLMAEPIIAAIRDITKGKKNPKRKIFIMDPAGAPFDQASARKLSKLDELILIAGRFEGIDERVAKFVDGAISVGPYVLAGGELPAAVIIEAITRLIPGALGHEKSNVEETFSSPDAAEYPHYTRPEVVAGPNGKKLAVPKVLLSGDHKAISEWRKKHRKK